MVSADFVVSKKILSPGIISAKVKAFLANCSLLTGGVCLQNVQDSGFAQFLHFLRRNRQISICVGLYSHSNGNLRCLARFQDFLSQSDLTCASVF